MSLKSRRTDFDATWKQLSETVKVVVSGGCVERSVWNDRFLDVYALCVANPEPLADQLYSSTKNLLEVHVSELYKQLKVCGEETLVSMYYTAWETYSCGCNYLNQLYRYLNTQYILKKKANEADISYGGYTVETEHMFEVGELGLDIWKRILAEPVRDTLVSLLLADIHKDRCHDSINLHIVHGTIQSFVGLEKFKTKFPLKIYEEWFEDKFLAQTGEFYRQESLKLLDESSCSEYMEKVIQRLDDEYLRSRKFLNGSSYAKVAHECQQRMVADHLQFLHRECHAMVHKEKRHDLANMYKLLGSVHHGLTVLVQEMEDYIRQTALDAVRPLLNSNLSIQFVETMLEIHTKYRELVQTVFMSDQQFLGALDKACSAAINCRPNPRAMCPAPEYLARYCDTLLKKTVKGINDSETDDKLASSITIFKYLDDKDIFNRFYARMLAKRLIYGLSQSMDAEEAMINRLKQACGYEFTNKLHRMFTDINLSNDLNAKFSTLLKEDKADLGITFFIMVLQAGAWPIPQTNLPTFALPQELEKSVQLFEVFYSKNYSGRKLTWIHTFCHGEVRLNYLKRQYFITMGLFLMAVLLPFNTANMLMFRDLIDITRLPSKELVRHIQQLVDAKLLEADNVDLEESTLSVNMAYSNKRTKFKIMSVQKEISAQEVEQTHTAVDEDRKLYIQAAIVRVMKARKVLKHALLIQEVLSQSQARFAPSISLIKKSIESLIDKQYIERTVGSTDEYSYIA
jgi:cullin 2